MTENFSDLVKDWDVYPAIAGAAAGGLVNLLAYVFQQFNSRKVSVGELIQEIESLATQHWCSPGSDTNNHFRAIQIYQKLKTLGWRINQNKNENKQALIDYRQAVTGANFEDPARHFVPFEDARIVLINTKAKDLRRVLGIKKYH